MCIFANIGGHNNILNLIVCQPHIVILVSNMHSILPTSCDAMAAAAVVLPLLAAAGLAVVAGVAAESHPSPRRRQDLLQSRSTGKWRLVVAVVASDSFRRPNLHLEECHHSKRHRHRRPQGLPQQP